jgi:hypothetical protein
MTNRTITAVVMAVGLVAASAGTAGAGSGGTGIAGGGGELFQCYNISAPIKANVTVADTNDEFTGPTEVSVPGAPQVLCVSANASGVTPGFNAFNPFGPQPDSVLCYAPQVSNQVASNVTITVNDPLTPGGTQTVRVNSTKYVCVQAITSNCPLCQPPR